MKYLIDSDWIIDHLNGVEAVTKRLEKFAASGLCTSVVSVAELYEGVYGSNNKSHFERIDSLKIISLMK